MASSKVARPDDGGVRTRSSPPGAEHPLIPANIVRAGSLMVSARVTSRMTTEKLPPSDDVRCAAPVPRRRTSGRRAFVYPHPVTWLIGGTDGGPRLPGDGVE